MIFTLRLFFYNAVAWVANILKKCAQNRFFIFLSKNPLITVFAFFILAFVIFVPEGVAFADWDILDPLRAIVDAILKLVLYLLNRVAGICSWVLSQTDVLDSTIITGPWMVIRDMANIGFIGILLVVSIMNIVGWQNDSYSVQKFLPQFIFAVVAINFSKLMVGIVLDFCNVVTATLYTFIGNDLGKYGENIPMHIVKIYGGQSAGSVLNCKTIGGKITECNVNGDNFLWDQVLLMILVIVLLAGLAAITVVFMVRMIWMWVLTVTAPLYFFGMSLDLLGNLKSKWEDKFTNMALMPIKVAAYMSIGFRIHDEVVKHSTGTNLSDAWSFVWHNDFSLDKLSQTSVLLGYILVIGILFEAVDQAKDDGWGDKVNSWFKQKRENSFGKVRQGGKAAFNEIVPIVPYVNFNKLKSGDIKGAFDMMTANSAKKWLQQSWEGVTYARKQKVERGVQDKTFGTIKTVANLQGVVDKEGAEKMKNEAEKQQQNRIKSDVMKDYTEESSSKQVRSAQDASHISAHLTNSAKKGLMKKQTILDALDNEAVSTDFSTLEGKENLKRAFQEPALEHGLATLINALRDKETYKAENGSVLDRIRKALETQKKGEEKADFLKRQKKIIEDLYDGKDVDLGGGDLVSLRDNDEGVKTVTEEMYKAHNRLDSKHEDRYEPSYLEDSHIVQLDNNEKITLESGKKLRSYLQAQKYNVDQINAILSESKTKAEAENQDFDALFRMNYEGNEDMINRIFGNKEKFEKQKNAFNKKKAIVEDVKAKMKDLDMDQQSQYIKEVGETRELQEIVGHTESTNEKARNRSLKKLIEKISGENNAIKISKSDDQDGASDMNLRDFLKLADPNDNKKLYREAFQKLAERNAHMLSEIIPSMNVNKLTSALDNLDRIKDVNAKRGIADKIIANLDEDDIPSLSDERKNKLRNNASDSGKEELRAKETSVNSGEQNFSVNESSSAEDIRQALESTGKREVRKLAEIMSNASSESLKEVYKNTSNEATKEKIVTGLNIDELKEWKANGTINLDNIEEAGRLDDYVQSTQKEDKGDEIIKNDYKQALDLNNEKLSQAIMSVGMSAEKVVKLMEGSKNDIKKIAKDVKKTGKLDEVVERLKKNKEDGQLQLKDFYNEADEETQDQIYQKMNLNVHNNVQLNRALNDTQGMSGAQTRLLRSLQDKGQIDVVRQADISKMDHDEIKKAVEDLGDRQFAKKMLSDSRYSDSKGTEFEELNNLCKRLFTDWDNR